MPEPYLGELKLVAFPLIPRGWAPCNGQLLAISQNQALFAVMGTMYGGDGQTTFALPNLNGAAAMGPSNAYPQGTRGGQGAVTLTVAQIPSHTHTVNAVAAKGTELSPVGMVWAEDSGGNAAFSPTGGAPMAADAIGNTGGQPHDNHQPYLALNWIVCLNGVFPSRT
jgi:microcystin-dependent protein